MSIHKRLEKLEALEGQTRQDLQPDEVRHSEARARMKEYLDEIAAARREGRAPSGEAVAVFEAIQRRRAASL
jgi:cytochrome P450